MEKMAKVFKESPKLLKPMNGAQQMVRFKKNAFPEVSIKIFKSGFKNSIYLEKKEFKKTTQ